MHIRSQYYSFYSSAIQYTRVIGFIRLNTGKLLYNTVLALLLLMGLMPLGRTAEAQSPATFATSAGGTGSDVGFGVSSLADGSAIVTGPFQGSATFGATTLTSAGDSDIFVAKIDADGNHVWAASAGGTGNNRGGSVSVSMDGSAIVTGFFSGTATFGATTLTSAGGNDIFVAKIDTDGNHVWAASAGGTGTDVGFGVSALADGSAIVTGRFSATATFGDVSLTATGHSNEHLFVAKISPTGTWLWATRAGATILDDSRGISASADGSAIITSRFRGTATFGDTELTTPPFAPGSAKIEDDVFVAKIDADGNWVWAAQGGGPSRFGHIGLAVSVLTDGSAIVTGKFNDGAATFGDHVISGEPGDDVFVAKISPAGTWLWAASAGGTGNDYGNGVSVLSDGSTIVTGSFQGMATFGATTLTSAGGNDVFVAKIDAVGNWVWATSAGGSSSDLARAVSALADGSAMVTGSFAGTATFGATELTSAGGNDVFVAKISASGRFDAATQIAVSAGNNQLAAVSTAVTTAPSVIVRDAKDNPVPGVEVTFAVTSGDGTIDPAAPATVTTDANGVAALTTWTLGSAAGANTLTATVAGLTGSPVTFTATGFGSPTQIAVQVGNDQTALVNMAVATPPSVVVRDENNTPVPGAEVTFEVTSGGGTIDPASPATVTTDANGLAVLTSWTLGAAAGANTLTATVAGSDPAIETTFTATGIAPDPCADPSTPGCEWTIRTSADNSEWLSVAYGNGLWVAIAAQTGTELNPGTHQVMTSADGITWTARTAAAVSDWRSIAYGDGIWVAVASAGTDRVMTSTDGMNWTARSAASASFWRAVVYGEDANGNGLWVAVASSGTDRVMTSTDGITWTA